MGVCVKYWLLDHPSIGRFRWSSTESWGSTWSFLVMAIGTYITTSLTLHVIFKIAGRRRGVPLGRIPAMHSLLMSVVSATVFTGMVISAVAEIRQTRWLWQRTRKHSLEWFLCFPLGIRPSGPVFFWSYAFYLSRLLHLFRTLFVILQHRTLSFSTLFNHSMLLLMSFLWLEFAQSFQVLAILFSTLVYTVVYGHRFSREIRMLPSASEGITLRASCQMLVLACFNLVCHIGVLLLHILRGGCNGIGAWAFNSVLNAAILFLFLNSYVNIFSQKKASMSAIS
ncbi:hypothetical protein VNO78_28734 [Psophocarpus tetragonolobus]|uniref:Elongation of fatty acids protein 3-like n=1 Tax=Psophocarpus tetragonolobus TaxID=3891 RepID=A0AAN9WYN6_PSOTE